MQPSERFLTVTEILFQKIKENYPNLSESEQNRILKEVVFAPDERLMKIGEEYHEIHASDLRLRLAALIEKPTLKYMSNELIEKAQASGAEISSVEEYFEWLRKTTEVLKCMNDGYVTKEDAALRESLLEELNFRENDLLLCLGLYEKNKKSIAKERWRFVCYKLQKLREMRTSIKFLTRQEENAQTTRSEYDTAVPYYQYFKKLQRAEFGQDLSKEAKERYGIRIGHEKDADLQEDYDHYAPIANEVLDEMMKENEQKQ